jgi:cytochrome c biogenesis protein CcdA
MKFKKTVNAFILISIALLVAFTFVFTAFIFYVLNSQNVRPDNSNLIIVIIGIIVSTVLCVLLIWLYYRLVYGIIIRKLDKNLKQLKDIESQEN